MFRLAMIMAALAAPVSAQQLAFPGAEGFGRFAEGGRGGAVYHVTTLADAGPGSLRECVEASGPRTCVFRVAGYIDLASALRIEDPNITIAGQTAPGQGITLTNRGGSLEPTVMIHASDVVIRHIRSRPAAPPHSVSPNGDGFRIGAAGEAGFNPTDVILDHVTMSWATDEATDPSTPMDRVTIQDSFMYEGLRPHSKGPNLRACGSSLIRNLIANNTIRNPNNTCGYAEPGNQRAGGGVTGENEFRNNMVFNATDGLFDYWNGRGPSAANIVGNVFLRGPSTKGGKSSPYAVDARDINSKYFDDGLMPGSPGYVAAGTTDPMALCLQDNITNLPGATRAAPAYDVLDPRDAGLVESTDCYADPVGDPDWAGGIRGMTGPAMPASEVEAYVLANAGALPWARDAADARVATQVAARQGMVPTSPADVGGWPTLAGGTPYPDADADGMDDAWEASTGMSDPNADANGDGWTNLEHFLAELAGHVFEPPPPPDPDAIEMTGTCAGDPLVCVFEQVQ